MCSLWILAIHCTKTKTVMKEENEIAKLQLQYKAYSQFTLTKTDEEILWDREYKMDKEV